MTTVLGSKATDEQIDTTAPENIWLQMGDDPWLPVTYAECADREITWCWEPCVEHEIRYIRADLVDAQIAAAVAKERNELRDLFCLLHKGNEEQRRGLSIAIVAINARTMNLGQPIRSNEQ